MTKNSRHILNPIPLSRLPSKRMAKFAVFLITALLATTSCSTQSSGRVKSGVAGSVWVESENQDTRVRLIVIHHTTGDFNDSFHVLTKKTSRPVSSHYLIPEPGDPSYSESDLKLYALVSEDKRAWHAGSSYWAGKTSLNDMSVGIELVNQTYCRGSEQETPAEEEDQEPARICFYPDFDDTQLAILTDLLKGILERHPDVKPTDIVGHADITPQRKIDPGPRFPWQRLYRLGYGGCSMWRGRCRGIAPSFRDRPGVCGRVSFAGENLRGFKSQFRSRSHRFQSRQAIPVHRGARASPGHCGI